MLIFKTLSVGPTWARTLDLPHDSLVPNQLKLTRRRYIEIQRHLNMHVHIYISLPLKTLKTQFVALFVRVVLAWVSTKSWFLSVSVTSRNRFFLLLKRELRLDTRARDRCGI